KDLAAMLHQVVGAFDQIVFTRYTINPRAVGSQTLLTMARELAGPESSVILEMSDDPVDAFRWLQADASPDDLICVTGSFFIAAEIRRVLLSSETVD
ncbi:MAG: bifunctional folylpolyglutamate synthase/dihydrofolate synthase, partial [Planctomycetia bacterium]